MVNYLARNLTHEKDRLRASAGIARHLEPALGGKHLVGIWDNENVRFQLAWYCIEELAARPLTRENIPSWSWASVSSRVTLSNHEMDREWKCHKVIHACVEKTSNGPLGTINGGFLLVEDPLNDFSLQEDRAYIGELDFALLIHFSSGKPTVDVHFDVSLSPPE
ncbi:hypothetical protein ACMFMG_002660 [Clarireedia jacksonii]